MSTDFYRAFEDRFRGSRDVIQRRLAVYLPFLQPFKKLSGRPGVVDLGCGRGEWLELLEREGLDARGVDLDDGMLKACEQLNLQAHKADAVGYLESLPNESVYVISAFHMVEHIPFEALQQLVQQALRVLVPGGLLIMEAPNPENLRVGTSTFYYDPTHQRPIPPLLLSFLPEHYGFARTKVLRLQQDPRIEALEAPSLTNVINDPSPDYGVVAQKRAQAQYLAYFDQPFTADYGLTLDTLAARYDTSLARQLEATRNFAAKALANTELTRETIEKFEATLQYYQRLASDAEHRVNELHNSTSWRATLPLRILGSILRKAKRLISRQRTPDISTPSTPAATTVQAEIQKPLTTQANRIYKDLKEKIKESQPNREP